jgi:hypothetical protein
MPERLQIPKHPAFVPSLLFVVMSGIFWYVCNGFIVASETGFDPLRYEYLAREGLPPLFAGSSSYSIVLVLQGLYEVFPPYIGYLVLAWALMYGALRLGGTNMALRAALLCPIAFYYIGQTGKDGIAIVALVLVGLVADSERRWRIGLAVLPIALLAIFVRPALVLLMPLIFLMFYRGWRAGMWAAILICLVFLVFNEAAIGSEAVAALEGAAGDEGTGGATKALREYSFGYEVGPIFIRFVFYALSPIFQPFLGLYKSLMGGEGYVAFEGVCLLLFFWAVVRQAGFLKFMKYALPVVLVLSVASPFYHFRYLAVVYPVLLMFLQRSKAK